MGNLATREREGETDEGYPVYICGAVTECKWIFTENAFLVNPQYVEEFWSRH